MPSTLCKTASDASPIKLNVLPSGAGGVRASRTSRWRALSLILVHLLMIAHIVQWLVSGRTVSPVEPSEAMYTLNNGYLNAGLIFFALTLLSTLIFGRFFCGWGCHVVAYQDFCGWLMKKIGVKPKPFRARFLILAPLALALYMFVWPTVYRVVIGQPAPKVTNHLMTSDFWQTFPGPVIAVLTFAICGFVIVYFLGAKGFCTYGCPYGGFFGALDNFAPGRILVTPGCEQCGHCTSVCTSNVRVHEEVAKFGMVVDPGCMKCMDCVSVCPKDALYFGFAKPQALGGRKEFLPPSPGFFHAQSTSVAGKSESTKHFDFTIAEELVFAVVGTGSLLAYRGLYGHIPLLMAMGMAAITGYVFIKMIRLVRDANLRLQNLSLKRGGKLTGSGVAFAAFAFLLFLFLGHSAVVQGSAWLGHRQFVSLRVPDDVWFAGNKWWEKASSELRESASRAARTIEFSEKWGFLPTPTSLQDLVWLYLARGDDARAEEVLRVMVALTPEQPQVHRGIAGVLRKQGRIAEAEAAYRHSLSLDPTFRQARTDLAAMLVGAGRREDAVGVHREGLRVSPDDTHLAVDLVKLLAASGKTKDAQAELARAIENATHQKSGVPVSAGILADLAVLEIELGNTESGIKHLREALETKPELHSARYNLAMALLKQNALPEAVEQLQQVVKDKPELAEAQYNLGVAIFMSGNPAGAIPHVQESLRLDPADAQAHEFLAVVHSTLGDSESAARESQIARRLRSAPGSP